jgi:hypothetical protein
MGVVTVILNRTLKVPTLSRFQLKVPGGFSV